MTGEFHGLTVLHFKMKACVAILFLAVVCSTGCDKRGRDVTEHQFIAKVFGGATNFTIVTNALNVTACILTPPRDPLNPKAFDSAKFWDPKLYTMSPSIAVTGQCLQELRAILGDRSLDDPDSAKGCIPIYGVRFSFVSDAGTVTVDLCFDCDMLIVSRDGMTVGGEDFDPAHKKLLRICRSLFPSDKGLQEHK